MQGGEINWGGKHSKAKGAGRSEEGTHPLSTGFCKAPDSPPQGEEGPSPSRALD